MLTLCCPIIIPHLLLIFNICREKAYFTNYWKRAVVKSIPKLKNPTAYTDIRPISLLPVISDWQFVGETDLPLLAVCLEEIS